MVQSLIAPQPATRLDPMGAYNSAVQGGFARKEAGRADALQTAEVIGRAAVAADTPQKWAQAMATLDRLGVPDAMEWAGKFEARDQIIRLTQQVSDQTKMRTGGQFLTSLESPGEAYDASMSAPAGVLSGLPAPGGYKSGPTFPTPPSGGASTSSLGGLRSSLARTESGGRSDVVNSSGYTGRYQFGEGALETAGLYDDPTPGGRNDWAGQFNIPGFENVRTQQDFAANPEAQEAAFGIYLEGMDKQLEESGAYEAIGQTIGGVEITRDGLLAMAHLGGVGGATRFVSTGGQYNPADSNGTRLSDYGRTHAGNSTGGGIQQVAQVEQQPRQGRGRGGIPDASLQILAGDPAYVDQAVATGLRQYGQQPVSDAWARLQDGALFNRETGEIRQAPQGPAAPVKPTASIQEYEYAKQQGFTGTFAEYEQQNRRAGGTNVTVGGAIGPEAAGDQKFAEAMAAKEAESFNLVMEGGRQAQYTIGDLNSLEAAMRATPTGSLVPFVTGIAGYAQSLGINILDDERLGGAQAIQAIVAKIAPRLRVPGAGTTSDKDLMLFLQSLPNLSQSEEGNRLIIDTLRKFAERSVQEAQIVNEAVASGTPRSQTREKLNSLGPVITPEEAASIFAPAPTPSDWRNNLPRKPDQQTAPQAQDEAGVWSGLSPDEAAALPPGSRFRTPDGQIRVRR